MNKNNYFMYKQAGRVAMALVGANIGNLAGTKLSDILGIKRDSWADVAARYGLGAAGLLAGGYFGNKYDPFDRPDDPDNKLSMISNGLGALSLYSLLKRHYQLDQPSNNVYRQKVRPKPAPVPAGPAPSTTTLTVPTVPFKGIPSVPFMPSHIPGLPFEVGGSVPIAYTAPKSTSTAPTTHKLKRYKPPKSTK